MARPMNSERAKALVEQIATDHGYLNEETLATMTSETRFKVENALLQKDRMIGSSVITLAKNLYTSKARFVFELLQNAEDNSYTKTQESPYVAFRVYPNRVILECNEDGFDARNLKAICSVGESSKAHTGTQGYIGEKGIGFKSVFMVARKVHIQSGAFSFSFSHKQGDSGMGMISPQWEDNGETMPAKPLTRITLYLHDSGDAEMLSKLRHSIDVQFKELQETILLFMGKLRNIRVSFYDKNDAEISSTTYSKQHPKQSHAILEKQTTVNGQSQTESKHFHVTAHLVTNLSKNENRSYSESDEATRGYATSQVILAFPLTEALVPIIEPQELFAFLPLRHVGFNFLIQADFVTDASRQDIVKDSLRNTKLLDGIAGAFIKAIIQFCEHEHMELRYQWMRYLPDKNAMGTDPFWDSLVEKISERLRTNPVVFGTRRPIRRLIKDLYRLQDFTLDEHGKPLFADGDPEQMISQLYQDEDLDKLKMHGLGWTPFNVITTWLARDLQQESSQSRMRSSNTSDSWHSKTAKLFSRAFTQNFDSVCERLRALHLLPLQDDTWGSALGEPVYFSKCEGIEIPSDLPLRVISGEITNPDRQAFFALLGVQQAPVSLVRQEILRKYQADTAPAALGLSNSVSHLKFLYLTHHLGGLRELSYCNIWVYDWLYEKEFQPFRNILYIVDDEPDGPYELLEQKDIEPSLPNGAPGCDALFLHSDYLEEDIAAPPGQDLTWIEWLRQKLRLHDKIVLLNNRNNELSYHGKYIQEHRPDKFLGCLRLCLDNIDLSLKLKNHLRMVKVLCRGNRQHVLAQSYFPTKELEARVERFIEPDSFFPWLWLDSETTPEAITPEWKSLLDKLDFGVPSTDLDFALDILKYFIESLSASNSIDLRVGPKIFQLYEYIQARFRETADRKPAQETVMNFFSIKRCIYVPIDEDGFEWALPSECVWDAPQTLRSKHVLKLLYMPLLSSESEDSSYMTTFFTKTIKIPNPTWKTYLDELLELKMEECDDSDIITGIYRALDVLRPKIIGLSKDEFRTAFEEEALIYYPSDGEDDWKKTSQCVWSRAAKLREKVSLNDEYEELEDLFVKLIGVKPVDLDMAIAELKEAASNPTTTIEDLVGSLWTVNSLLEAEPSPPPSQDIGDLCVFPIKNPGGPVTLNTKTTEFFIVDRETLLRTFGGKIKILNFTLKEVADFRPFIQWAHLEDRFLSRNVKEITSFHGVSSQEIPNPARQIRYRAHALLRVAMHFKSRRLRTRNDSLNFYELLRSSRVYEADGISTDLSVSQDNKNHTSPGEMASMHIDDDGESLKVYLPRDQDDQDYIFGQKFAHRLFEHMMTMPLTQISDTMNKDGVRATRDVLLAPMSRIAAALEDSGILPSDIANLDEDPTAVQNASSLATRTNDRFTRDISSDDYTRSDLSTVDTPTSTILRSTEDVHETDAFEATAEVTVARSQHGAARSSAPPPLISPLREDLNFGIGNSRYTALLQRVVEAARSSSLPHSEHTTANSSSVIHDWTDLGLRCASQFERDCRVGAAGELYVFELLSRYLGPGQHQGFSRDNWRSNVRKYVRAHPDYATMEPWEGPETSDITYSDSEGLLTNLMIQQGYLTEGTWAGQNPNYFIEVKTTTTHLETRFFMSKSQYRRMEESLIDAENRHTIYVIFRVYNLGQDNMGLKIYLDPSSLRREGVLQFTAETWSVAPTAAS